MTKPPRVLYCTDTFPPQLNGVSVVTALSVQGLRDRGWEVAVVSPSYPRGSQDVFTGVMHPTDNGSGAIIPSMAAPFYPDLRFAAPSRGVIAQVMEEFRPDLVHCATEFMIGWMGQQEALRQGIPVVSSYHTDFSRYAVEYGLPWLRSTVQRYIGRFHRRSRRVYTPGLAAQEELRALHIPDVEVWGRGVDTSLFHPRQRDETLRRAHAPDDAFLFLHVGRLAAEKGVERILEAFADARAVIATQRPVHLVIAGSGPREAALRMAAPAGVTFVGNLDRANVLPRLYASADAFLFASHTETLGLVILEAMASGLPVIAALAGGVADHLRDNINGLAYYPGDVAAMAEAMMRVATSDPLARRLGVGARQTAESLSWSEELDRLVESYRAVARLPQARVPVVAVPLRVAVTVRTAAPAGKV